jgi:hypothetical protein
MALTFCRVEVLPEPIESDFDSDTWLVLCGYKGGLLDFLNGEQLGIEVLERNRILDSDMFSHFKSARDSAIGQLFAFNDRTIPFFCSDWASRTEVGELGKRAKAGRDVMAWENYLQSLEKARYHDLLNVPGREIWYEDINGLSSPETLACYNHETNLLQFLGGHDEGVPNFWEIDLGLKVWGYEGRDDPELGQLRAWNIPLPFGLDDCVRRPS